MVSDAAAFATNGAAAGCLSVPAPRKSSFYLALRLLPPPQRHAMYAVYAFCRAVDDIADGEGPRADRLAGLAAWRTAVAALCAGRAVPGLEPLADARERYGLLQADFDAVIDGMAMDVEDTLVAPDRATLDLYVDRVAAAPGRLSVRVFGLAEAPGIGLAHHLGSALQLTNILRDLDEDAARGRLYLPREDLETAGIAPEPIANALAHPALDAACMGLARSAATHFDEAVRIMDEAPRRTVRAPRLMAAAYRPVLDKMMARGWVAPRTRISKSKSALLKAALRHAFF